MVKEYEFAAETAITLMQPTTMAAVAASAIPADDDEELDAGIACPAANAGLIAVPLYSAPRIDGGLDVERPQSGGSGGVDVKKANGSKRTK